MTVALPRPAPAGPVFEACAQLVNYLPGTMEGQRSRVVSPRSPLVHAWGSPPVVLRCGVPTPAGYDPSSAQAARVNGVVWFQHIETTKVSWTAVRREANIELLVPKFYEAQGGFLVDIGRAIKATIG